MRFGKAAKAVFLILMFLQHCDAIAGSGGIKVASDAFGNSGAIPKRHGFDHGNISPSITWSEVPEGARTIALICDDPDAPGGDWVHWVMFNIPARSRGLPEGMSKERSFPDGSAQGTNDFMMIGYDGPAPPRGTHRYIFRIFALDTRLDLNPGATKKELLSAMSGHILAEGRLQGTYKKEIDIPSKPMI